MTDDIAAQIVKLYTSADITIAPAAEPLELDKLPSDDALSAEAFRLHMISKVKSRGVDIISLSRQTL